MKIKRPLSIAALATAFAFFAAAIPAHAGLTLTTDGINDGFTLSTFVSGYSEQYGPLAQGIAPDGNVITGSQFNNQVYVFKDVDNQNLGNALNSVPYTCQTGNCNFAMTTAGGQVYGAQLIGGVYEHFNSDGTFSPIANLQADGLFSYAGMWADPVNGHIISSSLQGLVDIDPIAGTFRMITPGINPDGVSVSPDGSTAYVAISGEVQAYSIATGALLASYATGHSPDGTGVITGGTFNGDVIVNDNDGTVLLLDPVTGKITIIANGGTRGDFVSVDTSNGTLFLSQNEQVARLTCGPGCSFNESPEPGTVALFGTGLLGFAGMLRRKFRP